MGLLLFCPMLIQIYQTSLCFGQVLSDYQCGFRKDFNPQKYINGGQAPIKEISLEFY